MTQINTPGPQSELHVLSQKLTALEAELRQSVKRTRGRNRSIAFFGIVTILATAVYVGYGYFRFGNEVTPALVADNVAAKLQDNMPQVRDQLQQNLKSNAPRYVGNVLDQLQEVATSKADDLQTDAQTKIDAAMPDVQSNLYDSLKTTLDESQKATNAAPGSTDEQRFQALLDALGQTYGTETIKFVNQVHADYATQAIAFVDYLDKLAGNQGLDHRDQLYRKMFRTMFMLVRAHEKDSGKPSEMDTTMFQPAQ
jgi:hypothetical protein